VQEKTAKYLTLHSFSANSARMSELSNKIKALRGDLSAEEAGQKAGVSRESFYRIERGGSVKFETLRAIAKAFELPEADWLELVAAWLRSEIGEDANKLWIEPKDGHSRLREGEDSQVARAMMLFTQLNPADRSEITKAMERPEVRGCLPAINSVWEKFNSSALDRARRGVVSAAKKRAGVGDAPAKDSQ
jgi:transcriptional regulator with XRE-family HTH domain